MSYIICDDKKNYITRSSSNRFSITTDIKKATQYVTVRKAENVITNNCKSPLLRGHNWEAKYITEEDTIIDKPIVESTLNFDILEKVNELNDIIGQMEIRRGHLIGELQKIDLEIVDIEHAAEFYNLNASQGYKLYKLLHDSRLKRRTIKDELQKINSFLGTPMKSNDMENLRKSILGLDNRKYTPRINKELFGV